MIVQFPQQVFQLAVATEQPGTMRSAQKGWQTAGAGTGNGRGTGTGEGFGTGTGNGFGTGTGSGFGTGTGNGFGTGTGDGFGKGAGTGSGFGVGTGLGTGAGTGTGTGLGTGTGIGLGAGTGTGLGTGAGGVQKFATIELLPVLLKGPTKMHSPNVCELKKTPQVDPVKMDTVPVVQSRIKDSGTVLAVTNG